MALPPDQHLAQLAGGKWIAQALGTAASLGIAECLEHGPRLPADLAAELGLHAPSLRRLLRALASVGVFREDDEGAFGLSPAGELLRRDHPQSMWGMVRMGVLEEFWASWGALRHCIETGESGFRKVHGCGFFEHLRHPDHQDAARVFDEAMSGISEADAQRIASSYDFSRHAVIADLGGGHGRLLAAVLEAAPGARGWLCDLEDVLASAGAYLDEHAVLQRVERRVIDFFAGVPAGADAYLLKHILHDWDDEACVRILGHCRDGLAEGGRVLAVEAPLPPGNDPHPAKLLDLQMLVMTEGGRERSLEEYRALFDAAGLRLLQAHPTGSAAAVMEAARV